MMKKPPARSQLVMTLAVLLLAISSAAAGERIVAVGDIHGNYDGFVSILQRASLVDAETHWIGGKAVLVQTGDIFDRGVDVKKILDLLMRLEEEAAADGGQVNVLLGNHESMNLVGFYRDVNPEVYATFVDQQSEKRRKAAFKDFKKYWQARAAAAGYPNAAFPEDLKEQWMDTIPPGWLEYSEALGPDGRYGAWLRQRQVAVVIDGVLFIHGGIGPDLAGLSIEEINAKVASELATYDRLREAMVKKRLVPSTSELGSLVNAYLEQDPPDPKYAALAGVDSWFINSSGGPLWFRGAARWDEEIEGEQMAALLAGVGAERMVGGHTVQSDGRIEARFGGTVFLIDTGMLSSHYEGGQPSALVIEKDTFTAIYADGSAEGLTTVVLPDAA